MEPWDETGGWIFTEKAHGWMDRWFPSSYRVGAQGLREGYGYAPGLYGIKNDFAGAEPDPTEASEWPVPNYRHNLDKWGHDWRSW